VTTHNALLPADPARLAEEQQAIVEHIADGLLVLEPGTLVRHINRTAARLLGLSPQEVVGRRLSALVDFDTQVERVFATGQGYYDRELRIHTPTLNLHVIDTAVPIKNARGEVVSVVNTVREMARARHLVQRMAGSQARFGFEHILGRSAALTQAVEAARKAARGHSSVLLTGESGVGKEMFAQALHNASPRAEGAFVAINCAALPRDLVESELFGYVAGSFTGAKREGRPGKFEAASGGTLFLDEVGELPLDVQAKLLRVLQEREVVRVGDTRGIPVDVRLVCATHRDLRAMVAAQTFREDLFYRCHVMSIQVPALRERTGDVPLLAQHFLVKYATALQRPVCGFTPAAQQRLAAHPWPGNVRELENTMERVANLCDDDLADAEALGLPTRSPAPPLTLPGGALLTLEQAERAAIAQALQHTGHNVTQAAALLGVSRPTLYAKIERHGLPLLRRAMAHAKPAGPA
jgi:transcriptional regulator with PAS, ATPase and Fis domain